MISKNDVTELQNNLPFWKHLSDQEITSLTANAQAVHWEKDQLLHCGEQDCIGLLYIKSGSIRVYIISEEGREVTLFRLEAGAFCILSASCVLQTIDFEVSVEADSDSEIIQISSHYFAQLMKNNIYVELFSYKLATERFSDVMWAMQQILFTSFDKRLAAFLLEESQKEESDDLKLTHEQIARYVGSAREVVSRMLKYFQKEGYLSLYRGGVVLLDKAALQALSNE